MTDANKTLKIQYEIIYSTCHSIQKKMSMYFKLYTYTYIHKNKCIRRNVIVWKFIETQLFDLQCKLKKYALLCKYRKVIPIQSIINQNMMTKTLQTNLFIYFNENKHVKRNKHIYWHSDIYRLGWNSNVNFRIFKQVLRKLNVTLI